MTGFGDDGGFGEDPARGQRPDPMSAGPWFVRHAGRRTGPFDGARLRTMARRGALGRLHSLSVDGTAWRPATEVRAIFNADGSVAAEPAAEEADAPESSPFGEASGDEGFVELAPAPAARGSSGAAGVRPVTVGALVLATAMLALPTSRAGDGSLLWWWSEGALSVTVRGLCAVAALGAWSTAFLPPEPLRSLATCAIAGVLSVAAAIAAAAVGPAALCAGLLVPAAALLVALESSGSSFARGASAASIGLGAVAAAVAIGAVIRTPEAWGFVAAGLAVAGAAGLVFAGIRGSGSSPSGPAVFWGCVAASCGGLGAVFALSLGALGGDAPASAAPGATAAGLVLAFAALAWSAAHEAAATAHLLPRADPADGP